MLKYNPNLKPFSRRLRLDMTDAEQCLWARLRRQQLMNVQFYRQKPIGSFIADFYVPRVKLVVEVDGGQHFDASHKARDAKRTAYFAQLELHVLRFDNRQVLCETDAVVETIYAAILERVPR